MSEDQNRGSSGDADQNSKESSETLNSYHKIRQFAVICLQNLFKISSKTLFNYWQILFPSFMMKSQSPFSSFLEEDYIDVDKFDQEFNQMVTKEPTLFYLLSKHPPKLALPTQDSKFKSTIAFTLAIILEYSHVQRIPTALEKQD